MEFKSESAESIVEEIKPLLKKNWDETGFYRDIPLDPDFDRYIAADRAGILRVFTARDKDNDLCGYAIFFVVNHSHFKSSIQASLDVLYIIPESRGNDPIKFLLWIEKTLASEGVQVILHHINSRTERTINLFKGLGYIDVEVVLGKRIDKKE